MRAAGTLLLGLCAGLVRAQATPPDSAPATPAAPNAPPAALRRFQADDFALAYDVLVGTGRLESALRIAQQAVRELPADRAWRRRLAQVAEWLGRGDLAAGQWLALFTLGDRSDATVSAVLRLAPVLDDPTAALPAWAYRARHGGLSETQWNDLYWLFENSSAPRRGSLFFESQYRALDLPLLLDHAARLALHAGDEDRALALYLERVRLDPLVTEALLQAVFIRLRRDQLDQALALMRSQAARVPAQDQEFWRLLGQVAWEARDYPTSAQAYARGLDSRRADAGDWSRLIYLTRPRQPRRAAELALEAWRRYNSLEHLMLALEIHAELGDNRAQGRIYAALDARQRARAETQLGFLLGRAQFWQRQQQSRAAWADLRRAHRLVPHDEATLLTTLWFLIETGWKAELTQALADHEAQARQTPAYWPVYAAGRMVLGQAREAGVWYRKALARTPDDALLLAAYADALDQQRQTGLADRVRLRAWQRLEAQRAGRQDLPTLMQQPEFMVWLRLWLRRHPGDPSLALMRQTLKELRGVGPAVTHTTERDELVLAWTLARELPESARRWAWEHYLRLGRTPHPSAASQLALRQGDRAAMEQVLRTQGQALPPTQRFDLALAADRTALALDGAFHGLEHEGEDASLHDRWRQQAPRQAHYLQLRAFSDNMDLLARQGTELGARLVLDPRLHLLLDWTRIQQTSRDPDFGSLLPGSDRLDSAELRWIEREHETRVALQRRTELDSVQGLRLRQHGRWMARLGYEFDLNYHGASLASLPLRAAGYESSVQGALNYKLDRRNYLRLAPRWSRYYTQLDDYLGSGTLVDLETGHRFRTDYPDWRARLYVQDQRYNRDGALSAPMLQRLPASVQAGIAAGTLDPVGYFLPQDSTTVGACLAVGDNLTGQSLQDGYSRAWRPYADLCLRNNSVLGSGYAATLGLAGSVAGPDHLSIQWQGSDGSVPGSAALRALSVRYRHYF